MAVGGPASLVDIREVAGHELHAGVGFCLFSFQWLPSVAGCAADHLRVMSGGETGVICMAVHAGFIGAKNFAHRSGRFSRRWVLITTCRQCPEQPCCEARSEKEIKEFCCWVFLKNHSIELEKRKIQKSFFSGSVAERNDDDPFATDNPN